jgi:hypothetical protein
VLPLQRAVYFPEDKNLSPWVDTTALKRYNLTFPFYPFRTLAPRDMHLFRQSGGRFEPSSPLFPAHTQINLTFKRRDKKNLLDFMVPEKLDPLKGSKNGTMSATERNDSLEFGGSGLNPPRLHNVLSVNVKLNDAYLVVRRFFLFFDRYSLELLIFTHARAGPPDQVQRHLSGTSAEQRFHRLPQHLHGCPESDTVHLRSGLGKPGQTPGGVHLVHQVRIASSPFARRLRTPPPPAPDAGSDRRLRTPVPDAAGRRTPPVRRRTVSRAGVTRPRPGRFRIDDRYIFAAHQLFVFRSVAENPTSSATRKRTKRFRHRVRDHDDTRGEQKT